MPERIQRIYAGRNILGEGPVWSVSRNGLFWVDIKDRKLQFISAQGEYKFWQMAKMPSAVAECTDGKLIVALQDEVIKFDPDSAASEHIVALDQDRPGNRSNDGKCDCFGNFWVGTMQDEAREARGRLWCITPSKERIAVLDEIGIANSPAWDAKRERFYLADSMAGVIYRFRFSPPHALSARAVFADNNGASWCPDGSAIDTEGCLWNAQWDGARIVRYAPDGEIDRIISVPVKRPTSCCFGGPDFSELYITSARSEDPADTLGGGVFSVKTSYRGLPAERFAG